MVIMVMALWTLRYIQCTFILWRKCVNQIVCEHNCNPYVMESKSLTILFDAGVGCSQTMPDYHHVIIRDQLLKLNSKLIYNSRVYQRIMCFILSLSLMKCIFFITLYFSVSMDQRIKCPSAANTGQTDPV